MTVSNPRCPKCESAMQPGCPVESAGEHYARVMSTWRDGLPVVQPGLLWGEEIVLPQTKRGFYLFGFRCVECGFVEHYALSKPDLKDLLAAVEKTPRSMGPSGQEEKV